MSTPPRRPSAGRVRPTAVHLHADARATGRGVTIAFLDTGFSAHPDLREPEGRIRAFFDASDPQRRLEPDGPARAEDWRGTQSSVVAAGDGTLSGGRFRGLASRADLVLVCVGSEGRVREEEVARGLDWVLENRETQGIRIVSVSVRGEDVSAPGSRVREVAEEAARQGLVVVLAAAPSAEDGAGLPDPSAPWAFILAGGLDDRLERGPFDPSRVPTSDEAAPDILVPSSPGVAAPILPGTPEFRRAGRLSRLAAAGDAEIPGILGEAAGDGEDEHPADAQDVSPDQARARAIEAIESEEIVAGAYRRAEASAFAAPIVASVAAQMLEVNPHLSPSDVKRLLVESAEPFGDADSDGRHAILGARAAVQAARREARSGVSVAPGPPRVAGGRLLFVYQDETARRVRVSGEFNGWNPTLGQFSREPDGTWVLDLPAPAPGRYRYKLLIDETRWISDPTHDAREPGPFGGFDSVLEVPEPADLGPGPNPDEPGNMNA